MAPDTAVAPKKPRVKQPVLPALVAFENRTRLTRRILRQVATLPPDVARQILDAVIDSLPRTGALLASPCPTE